MVQACDAFSERTGFALPRLLGQLQAEALDDWGTSVAPTLEAVLDTAPPAHQIQGWVLDVLQQAAEGLAHAPRPPTRILARAFLLFREAGRVVASDQIALAVSEDRPTAPSASHAMMCAWAEHLNGDTDGAIERLHAALRGLAEATTADRERFDAWGDVGVALHASGNIRPSTRVMRGDEPAGCWIPPTCFAARLGIVDWPRAPDA